MSLLPRVQVNLNDVITRDALHANCRTCHAAGAPFDLVLACPVCRYAYTGIGECILAFVFVCRLQRTASVRPPVDLCEVFCSTEDVVRASAARIEYGTTRWLDLMGLCVEHGRVAEACRAAAGGAVRGSQGCRLRADCCNLLVHAGRRKDSVSCRDRRRCMRWRRCECLWACPCCCCRMVKRLPQLWYDGSGEAALMVAVTAFYSYAHADGVDDGGDDRK